MALRWTHDPAHGVDRVIVTDDWPSARARQRVLDALDRAGHMRQHVPILIDLRELRGDAVAAYRDMIETFSAARGAHQAARRAILTVADADAGAAARTLVEGLASKGPVALFTNEGDAVHWLRGE